MTEYRVPSTTKVGVMIAAHTDLLEEHGVSGGLHASRPAAGTEGNYYFSIDSGIWSRDNGTTWDEVSGLSEVYIQGLIDASITTHSGAVDPHGDRAYTDSEISALHAAPTYDGVNDEVVFQI